jgi:PAS domain S-box-containing protein
MRILVVDDHPQNREVLIQLLRAVGHEPVAAANGVEALERLREGAADGIISDILMPRMDGFQLCRELRANPDWASTPFIFYTATYTDPKDETFALELGADRFLTKPAEPEVLLQALGEVLARSKSARPTAAMAPQETELLEHYNQRLVRKLESKVQELEATQVRLQAAHTALRDSEARFREIYQNTSDCIYVVRVGPGRRFIIEDVNRAQEQVSGQRADDLRERDLGDALSPDRAMRTHERLSRCAETGQAVSFDECLQTQLGEQWFHTVLAPIRNAEGDVVRIAGISRDITPRRRAEEAQRKLELQLQQAQKLEALGTLAGGIAHDFNNLLTAILGHAELLKLDPLPPNSRLGVDEMIAASLRARDLVQQILTFSRRQPQERIPRSLGKVITEAVRLVRSTVAASIEITAHLPAAETTVLADASQIHQVVLNLCVNAAHAIGDHRGRIEVRLEMVELTPGTPPTHPPLPAGPYLRLSVSDNGCGMDSTTLKRVFEPFFTTKAPGVGTGLGLAVVHGIVQNHDGALAVESAPGQGSVFRVFLPPVESDPAAVVAAEAGISRGRGQRVLVVDDEPAVARLAAMMLEQLGYQASIQEDPESAIATFSRQPDDFALVLTDFTMPRITGLEFARALWALRPGVPIILTTGFAPGLDSEKVRSLGFRSLLPKPYTVRSLADGVAAVLGGTATPRQP